MADLELLYKHYGTEKAMELLKKAEELARENPKIDWGVIQNTLKIGSEPAVAIMDWLADNHRAEWKISEHWIRRGRTFVLNHPFPDITEMVKCMGIGEKRAYAIMQALEKRRVIRVKENFAFERQGRMSSFKDLARQMRVIAKKYRGRCEPWLLQRLMYVDPLTAMRLAQYGEEFLGLKWKERTRELM